jgi:hypothetical protein
MRNGTLLRRGAAALAWLLLAGLAACEGPIVARSPQALYALAQEQLANSQFRAATDTLKRVSREFPTTEQGQRAAPLHIALEGGLARGYQSMGDAYLEGSKQPGATPQAGQLRAVAMDYFGRARSESIEVVESLEWLMKQTATEPFRLEAPVRAPEAAPFPAQVRAGKPLNDPQRARAEQAEVWRGIQATVTALGGAGTAIEPAVFYLGASRELVETVPLFSPDKLNEGRMAELYYERAAAIGRYAAQLAQTKGDRRTQKEAEALVQRCQQALAKR